jgi:hypothetical protein
MRKTVFVSLTLMSLLLPGLLAAASPAPIPTPFMATPGTDCGAPVLPAPAMSPVGSATAANPLAGVFAAQLVDCCTALFRACRTECICGFQFSCNPSTCESVCQCNDCP